MVIDLGMNVDALAQNGEMSYETLIRFWESLPPGSNVTAFLLFEEIFLAQFPADHQKTLNFSPGGWVVKATAAGIRTAILTALLTLALNAAEAKDINLLVLPAILPIVFDLEKVRLSRSDSHILAELTMNGAVRGKTTEELYSLLPQSIRDEVAPLAFHNFLENCERSGNATEESRPLTALGESRYELRPPGSECFHVTFL
jgi:hypothetical protein